MKKLLIGLALLVSASSQAQTSKTATPTVPGATSTSSSTANVPNTNTSTIQTSVEQNSIRSRFGANFIAEAFAGVGDLKENNTAALIDSYNAIGLTYKISETLKTELRHNYQLRAISDREQLKVEKKVTVVDPNTGVATEETQVTYEEPYKSLDPTIHLNVKTPFTILGSKPIASANRYYIPVSQASRDSKTYGTFRSTHIASWDLTTRWALDALAEVRLTMNRPENSKAAIGSDSTLRYIGGPALSYNFSDKLSAYYMPYVDLVTTGHQRGDFSKADQRNNLHQDLGVNVVLGKVTINPYVTTMATRAAGKEGYEGAGSDKNSSYNLLVQAVF